MTTTSSNPVLRLASLMTLYGLAVAGGGPIWANYLMQHLPDGRWDYRMTFLAACATALGGMFLRWFAAGQGTPGAFPVLIDE
jgi:hypothetical protein